MKLMGLGFGMVAVAAAFVAPPSKVASERWAVILGGDTDGYLSPCGCTSPMTGGIRRRATATRELAFPGHTVILDNGSLVEGSGRQAELKAETMAQFLGSVGAAFVNLSPADARLGQGMALSLQSLSGGRFGSSSLVASSPEFPSPKRQGPFIIAGVSMDPDSVASPLSAKSVAVVAAVGELVDQAATARLTPLLLLHGNRSDAVALARQFPSLALIQYRAAGDAPRDAERVGNTVIASVGEDGKSVVRLVWDGQSFSRFTTVRLGPTFADDAAASRIYGTYLQRVSAARLLGSMPRRATEGFAGSSACVSCHASVFKIWQASDHSHALATLEKDHEQSDPDCVSCHVTGLESTRGFRSRSLTPQLSFVGCESCHGPALDHARDPRTHRLSKVGERTCIPCHASTNSPNFVFQIYWAKIRH